jgi:hypothetical protein
MTIREHERRERQRGISEQTRQQRRKSKSLSPAEAARRRRQREQDWRAAPSVPQAGIPRVIPWLQWIKLRGISVSTAERLQRAGKVKVTYMSERRKGVREDHDREYLDSCTRGGA